MPPHCPTGLHGISRPFFAPNRSFSKIRPIVDHGVHRILGWVAQIPHAMSAIPQTHGRIVSSDVHCTIVPSEKQQQMQQQQHLSNKNQSRTRSKSSSSSSKAVKAAAKAAVKAAVKTETKAAAKEVARQQQDQQRSKSSSKAEAKL